MAARPYLLGMLLLICTLSSKAKTITKLKSPERALDLSVYENIEFLFYDDVHRQKRSTHETIESFKSKHMYFKAFNREFNILLASDKDDMQRLITHKSKVEVHKEEGVKVYHLGKFLRSSEQKFVYSKVLGQNSSLVSGVLDLKNHVFQGNIHINNETFYVEKLKMAKGSIPGYGRIYKHKLKLNSKYAPIDKVKKIPKSFKDKQFASRLGKATSPFDFSQYQGYVVDVDVVCDVSFYTDVANSSVESSVIEVLGLISEADYKTYRPTDFDSDGSPDNIGLSLDKIIVYTSQNALSYPSEMKGKNYETLEDGGESYLNDASSFAREATALVITLNNLNFQDTLGVAWLTGMCFPFTNGIAYNNGMVSYYQAKLLPYVEQQYQVSLTVAHEIGHLFGADHDPLGLDTCTPHIEDGIFLMFPFVTKTDYVEDNNYQFSPCSVADVHENLDFLYEVGLLTAPFCLHKPYLPFALFEGSYCGDGTKDSNEQCDCGLSEHCSIRDMGYCCVPANPDNSSEVPCTLRSNATCSSKHSCCDKSTCDPRVSGYVCQPSTECRNQVLCDGISPFCAREVSAAIKSDGTPCASGSRACYEGECARSRCLSLGLEHCQTTSKETSCNVWCKNSQGECLSIHSLGLDKVNDEHLKHPGGTLCASNTGICSSMGKCFIFEECENGQCTGDSSNGDGDDVSVLPGEDAAESLNRNNSFIILFCLWSSCICFLLNFRIN